MKDNILFIHAWSGCDTTSQCFGFGKTYILKYLNNKRVMELAKQISNESLDCQTVGNAGVKLFCYMYDPSGGENLTNIRFLKFKAMMAEKNKLDVKRLPSTNNAAYFQFESACSSHDMVEA